MAITMMVLAALMLGGAVARDQPAPCQVQVIVFVPAGVEPPPALQERVEEIVSYSEAFFRRGLQRWGHKDPVMPFRRSADGRVEVRTLRGRHEASHYKAVTLRAEVMDTLRGEGRIDRSARQVWWILVYAGEPPARFEGFLGGIGEDIGGWATCNLDTTPGRIDPGEPLGSEFLAKLMLKGMMHELGHAFGLPHIGPLERDQSGNTLMGTTHINWQRVVGDAERRMYLSEAEAALLSRHPAFRGVADDRGKLPALQLDDIRCVGNGKTGTIAVSGRISAPERAVYALVADESDDRPGEYWTKTYVGRVAADGSFKVLVSEASRGGGTLRIWFLFEDGDHTGNGKGRSRPSGIAFPYTYEKGKWVFEQ